MFVVGTLLPSGIFSFQLPQCLSLNIYGLLLHPSSIHTCIYMSPELIKHCSTSDTTERESVRGDGQVEDLRDFGHLL